MGMGMGVHGAAGLVRLQWCETLLHDTLKDVLAGGGLKLLYAWGVCRMHEVRCAVQFATRTSFPCHPCYRSFLKQCLQLALWIRAILHFEGLECGLIISQMRPPLQGGTPV